MERLERNGNGCAASKTNGVGRYLGIEVTLRFLPLGRRQPIPLPEMDSVSRQLRQEAFTETGGLAVEACHQPAVNLGQQRFLLRRGLFSQDRDPFHEKLVQVRGENRQELQPLKQRSALVQSLRQHAVVEIQPAQIAVNPNLGKRLSDLAVENSAIANRHHCRHAHSVPPEDLQCIPCPKAEREYPVSVSFRLYGAPARRYAVA